MTPAVLVLADGLSLEGYALGAPGVTMGELCFNTGMTGYQEVFTDPSYFGQLLIASHVHIGNYGTIQTENESERVQIAGLICREYSPYFSRGESAVSLDDFFAQNGLTGIWGVDTRALVNHVRQKGAMNAIISTASLDPVALRNRLLDECPSMLHLELASRVSTTLPYRMECDSARFHVAVLDYGVKRSILHQLVERGCALTVLPHDASAQDVLALKPDGVVFSNGPGDPQAMPNAVETAIELLAADTPILGICLGHQVLAQACGLATYKMHFGHRGLNQPVLNLRTGRGEITSQNHGFAVDANVTGRNDLIPTHVNLNDRSNEGFQLKGKPVISVQYHPEAGPGPHDSRYIFDDFVAMLG